MRGAEGIVLKILFETTVSASKGKKLLILFDNGCRFIDLSSVFPANKKPESKAEVERLLVWKPHVTIVLHMPVFCVLSVCAY